MPVPPRPSASKLLASYQTAFDRWAKDDIATARLKLDSSLGHYAVLWAALAKFAVGAAKPVALTDLTPQVLADFIASRRPVTAEAKRAQQAAPRYVWRLLTVIDRVLAHRAQGTRQRYNDAAIRLLQSNREWQFANAGQRDALPPHLGPRDAAALVHHLSQSRPRPGRPLAPQRWQDLRNRTALALQLGAGITPAEVRALTVADVLLGGGPGQTGLVRLRLPANATAPAREAPVLDWAAKLLRHWLTQRTAIGLQGPWLFPSVRSGKPWSKLSQYGAVEAVLKETPLDASLHAGGSFRLRHTYAMRQLRKNVPAHQVATWLGVSDPAVMARYQRVVLASDAPA